MAVDAQCNFRMRITMDLKDALVPFLPAGLSALQDNAHTTSCTRVAFLSERLDLKTAMQRMLPTPQYVLTQVCSTELIEKAIEYLDGVCAQALFPQATIGGEIRQAYVLFQHVGQLVH